MLRERPAAAGIELGQHVVEEKQRWIAATVGNQVCLGEEQSENDEPLLALGAEASQVTRPAQ